MQRAVPATVSTHMLSVRLTWRCVAAAQELQQVKDTLIGEDVDGAVSGISGGERRRVSVGIGARTQEALGQPVAHARVCTLVTAPCCCCYCSRV